MTSAQHLLSELRRRPVEWRRRGLTPPRELDRMVAIRLLPDEPCYGDFFVTPDPQG